MFKPRSALVAMLTSLAVLISGVIAPVAGPPVIVLAAASVATCAPNSGTATIGGTVTGTAATPLNGVSVTAYTSYGQQAGSASTNASGVYQITGLIGGSYILQFKPFSGAYVAEWYNNKLTAQSATPVVVAEGGAVTSINAQLETGAQFSGNVSGAGVGALQSVFVSVHAADNGDSVASAYTDASGNYTTSPGLTNGTYRVEFEKTSTHLGTFYNDKPSLETADPLVVTAPGVQAGINATLAQGGQLTGTVTSAATGLPLANIAVSASGANGDGGYDYTDASGKYTITGLPSNIYTVKAVPSSSTINLIGAPKTATVVAPNTTTGVNFALAPGGTLSGRVTDSSGTPLNNITIYLGSEDGSYQEYVYTNATGVYTATGMPSGQYQVFFRPSTLIPEAYNNHPDFGDADLVTVTAPNTVTGIDAALDQGGKISGKVTDASTGLPIKDIFVEVLDADGDRVENAYTQADGSYATYTTLPSGSYKVRFNADERFASCTYVTEYYNDKTSEAGADLVTVNAPNPVANIDAALTRGSILFGKLTEAATGAPITSGQITVYDAAGKNVMFGRLSSLGGWHTQTGLPSGSYRIKFSDYSDSYIDEFYNDKLTLETADPVVVNAPTDLTGINAALAKGATISGKVNAADTGLPFSDGDVVVYNAAGDEVGYSSIGDDGSYNVLNGLSSGDYRIAVVPYSAEGEGAASLAAVQPAQGGTGASTSGYSTTFYGSVTTLSAATPVSLAAPTATDGINIAMLRNVWLPVVKR